MKKIRIAGAQIPIKDNDIQYNKNEILKSLDWAKENNVDLIQTPEAALSGYNFNFWEANMGEIVESLKEIESKQKEYGIGLNLGTCIVDYEMYGAIKRNQVRHYSNTGELYGITNKTYLVHADGNCIPNFHDLEISKDELMYPFIVPQSRYFPLKLWPIIFSPSLTNFFIASVI